MAEGLIPLKPNKQRDWESMTDKEVLGIAGRIIDENGIRNKNGLKKADSGLYTILYKRKLLDKVDVEAGKRTWGPDEEVLKTARRFIEENGITNRSGLQKVDYGLYQILKNRKLLGKVKFKKWRRKWGTNDEVLVIARKLIEEKGIPHPSGLMKADSGLYQVLLRRKLLHKVGFEERQLDWKTMNDENVLAIARRKIEEDGIRNPTKLHKADSGLYYVLWKRKLLDKVKFEERKAHRKWGTDEEVLETARRFIEKNEIRNRHGLEKADNGLYQVLLRRRLIDRVFASIDQTNHKAAVQGVLDAMDSFGDDR